MAADNSMLIIMTSVDKGICHASQRILDTLKGILYSQRLVMK